MCSICLCLFLIPVTATELLLHIDLHLFSIVHSTFGKLRHWTEFSIHGVSSLVFMLKLSFHSFCVVECSAMPCKSFLWQRLYIARNTLRANRQYVPSLKWCLIWVTKTFIYFLFTATLIILPANKEQADSIPRSEVFAVWMNEYIQHTFTGTKLKDLHQRIQNW